jgi:hypothetical protein
MSVGIERVISYSFFRSPRSRFEQEGAGSYRGRFFARHFPAVIRACAANFPGWQIRVHHDQSLWECEYAPMLENLQRHGIVKLVDMGHADTLCGSMLWRMAPLWDKNVERFICRDLDSVPSPRDRMCVEQWIRSGKPVHAIHDHEYHAGTALMGGMCGFSGGMGPSLGLRTFEEFMLRARDHSIQLDVHGADQRLLNAELWPKVKKHCLMHQLKSERDEGAAMTVTRPVFSKPPETWMVGAIGQQALDCPHIGAVFTEYEGSRYEGPTFDEDVVERRLKRAERLYDEALRHVPSILYSGDRTIGTVIEDAEREAMLGDRRVVFSTNVIQDYAFLAPLTALMWRAIVGYQPIILCVGTPEQWNDREANPAGHVALKAMQEVGAQVHHIPALEGHRDSTVAQVSRLFASALPLPESTYLITGDADMFPMSKEFFTAVDRSKPMHVLFANAYMKDIGGGKLVPEGKYPICYLGATVGTWRRVMQIPKAGGGLVNELRYQLDAGLGRDAGSDSAWNYDEVLFMVRFAEWAGRNQAQMRDRSGAPPRDRIDRGDWNNAPPIASASDAHLLRPAHRDDNWAKVRPLLEAKLTAAQMEWVDKYRAEFVAVARK